MTRRFKKQFLAEAVVGVVIIAAVGLGLHIYGFPRSADAPIELASNSSEGTTQSPNEPSGEKDRPAEPPELVLHASLAGSWYPADADTLRKQLAGFFEKADVKPIDNVIGLVLPHAGYSFSGQTAAMALKRTEKKYKRIIVIGPAHRMYMEEILSVPRATHFQTPLGRIPLDTEFINRVLRYPLFQNVPRALDGENSVEMEIPLLQYKFQDFKLVPLVAGSCSPETINRAGAILKSLIDEETLVVASSDFVHYGAGYKYVPFTKDIPEQIRKLDMGAYEHIAKLDSKGFLQYRQKTGATICGYIPVAILLSMLDAPAKAEMIKYATSGELTGDFSNSVSYLSIVFSGAWKEHPQIEPETNAPQLTEEDKKGLLTLARKTISYGLERQRAPQVSELGVTISEAMKPPRAAFVTLKKNGRLRGCIGDIFPRQPLYNSVLTNAINAAFRDQRFAALQEDELEDITIEISALTPPEPVSSYEKIRIGTDGIVLRKAGRSAVFLPQVAGEQGWDLSQTLTQLSLKAQLKADDWKEGASFLVFQAEVFGESEK